MVEVEVREDERNLLSFEDIVDTLDMAEEAYYLGYTLSNPIAKVEFMYFYLDKVSNALGNSIVESKYYMVHTMVARFLSNLWSLLHDLCCVDCKGGVTGSFPCLKIACKPSNEGQSSME